MPAFVLLISKDACYNTIGQPNFFPPACYSLKVTGYLDLELRAEWAHNCAESQLEGIWILAKDKQAPELETFTRTCPRSTADIKTLKSKPQIGSYSHQKLLFKSVRLCIREH
jgi:hypothetical protein